MTVGPTCLPDRPHSAQCRHRRRARKLLDGDRRASGLELGLGLLGGLLGDLLEQRLGGAVDQILGLFQAQSGDDLADNLDDADLLVAGTLEDDVELRLLLGGLGGGTACGGTGSGRDGDRGGGGDLEGLLELLDELRELQQRQFLERVEQVVSGQLGHGVVLPYFFFWASGVVLEEASTQLPRWPSSLAARLRPGRPATPER